MAAVLLVLLISVVVVGAAFAYMVFGHIDEGPSIMLEVTNTTCDSERNVTINVINSGQKAIDLLNEVTVTRQTVVGIPEPANIVKIGMVNPGSGGKITDAGTGGCGSTAAGATCLYTIVAAGRADVVNVTCT